MNNGQNNGNKLFAILLAALLIAGIIYGLFMLTVGLGNLMEFFGLINDSFSSAVF